MFVFGKERLKKDIYFYSDIMFHSVMIAVGRVNYIAMNTFIPKKQRIKVLKQALTQVKLWLFLEQRAMKLFRTGKNGQRL